MGSVTPVVHLVRLVLEQSLGPAGSHSYAQRGSRTDQHARAAGRDAVAGLAGTGCGWFDDDIAQARSGYPVDQNRRASALVHE